MTNDPIADMLTRMRNAIARGREKVIIPSSRMIEAIAKILEEKGFIDGYKIIDSKPGEMKNMELDFKYVNGVCTISHLERVSKPGLRIYLSYREIPKIRSGLGITILSTSKGVLSGTDAIDAKMGGEYLLKLW